MERIANGELCVSLGKIITLEGRESISVHVMKKTSSGMHEADIMLPSGKCESYRGFDEEEIQYLRVCIIYDMDLD